MDLNSFARLMPHPMELRRIGRPACLGQNEMPLRIRLLRCRVLPQCELPRLPRATNCAPRLSTPRVSLDGDRGGILQL